MEFYIERYKNREKLNFQCEVITPMFISGANPNEVELRAPSIKGALRFWWRALYGNRFSSMEKMRKEESEIFGSTEKKSNVKIFVNGFNNFHISAQNLTNGRQYTVHGHNLSIFDYLAYGIYEYDNNKQSNGDKRKHITSNSQFTLHLEFSNSNGTADSILKSLSCLNSFGGLGAKSRNGFGCIAIKPLDTKITLPMITEFTGSRKDYTSFNSDCKLFTFQPQEKWEDALSDIGIAYRTARLSIKQRHRYEKRPLLAKPLIVQRENIFINGRHAKPYFLHVSKLLNNKYQGSILFIPYNYYEQNNLAQYNEVCNSMNQKLQELSSGGQ